MTFLLAAVNARYTHISLALRCLRNALSKKTADPVLIREYVINQDRLEILQDIARCKPDILMLSVYIWNSRLVSSLIPDLRSLLPACKIILGGPEVSYTSAQWLEKHEAIDLIVCGPGETAIAELADGNFSLEPYPDKVLRSGPCKFDSEPLPYTTFDYPEFSSRYVYYESSRGCPFSCSYCLSSHEGHSLQMKSVEKTCDELDFLMAGNPFLFKFIDRTFNSDPSRARGIWTHILENYGDFGTRFHFEIYPGLLSDSDLDFLAKVPRGLFQFEIGIQTVNKKTREAIARGGDWGTEKPRIKKLLAAGNIHVHVDLIAGLPHEGVRQIRDSFDEVLSLGAEHVQMGFLKGLPGTAMRDSSEGFSMAFMREAPYEILRSRWVNNEDLFHLKCIAELLENTGNTHKYDKLLAEQAAFLGGWYDAYESLLKFCNESLFDIRTRNEVKVRPLLETWAAGAKG